MRKSNGFIDVLIFFVVKNNNNKIKYNLILVEKLSKV